MSGQRSLEDMKAKLAELNLKLVHLRARLQSEAPKGISRKALLFDIERYEEEHLLWSERILQKQLEMTEANVTEAKRKRQCLVNQLAMLCNYKKD